MAPHKESQVIQIDLDDSDSESEFYDCKEDFKFPPPTTPQSLVETDITKYICTVCFLIFICCLLGIKKLALFPASAANLNSLSRLYRVLGEDHVLAAFFFNSFNNNIHEKSSA